MKPIEQRAEEFWNLSCKNDKLKSPSDIMIEFAKLHVEAALKEASKQAIVNIDACEKIDGGDPIVDKESILNAYPLKNIK